LEDSFVGVTAAIASGAAVIGLSHLRELPSSPRLHVLPSLKDINLEKLQDIYGRLVFA
jgi:beta-phosphoglucomutase-like phosphatase (HAD superfamily)